MTRAAGEGGRKLGGLQTPSRGAEGWAGTARPRLGSPATQAAPGDQHRLAASLGTGRLLSACCVPGGRQTPRSARKGHTRRAPGDALLGTLQTWEAGRPGMRGSRRLQVALQGGGGICDAISVWDSRHRGPQAGKLRATEGNCLPALEASLPAGRHPSEAPRDSLLPALPSPWRLAGNPRGSRADSRIAVIPACLHTAFCSACLWGCGHLSLHVGPP